MSRYIGLVVSNEIISEGQNTGTPFPMMSLKSGFIFIEVFRGVVIVRSPGGVDPGLVVAMLQLVHHGATVSQFSYVQAAFGRSTFPFPQ